MTITWTETQRLVLIRIIGEWIMNGDGEQEHNELAQLIVFLACMPGRFLDKNRSKFADALVVYEDEQ